jgi:hypothetical protein
VASIPRTGRPAHKKYVPSEKQLAEDRAKKERLDHLTDADIKKFDRLLGKAIKPLPTRTP